VRRISREIAAMMGMIMIARMTLPASTPTPYTAGPLNKTNHPKCAFSQICTTRTTGTMTKSPQSPNTMLGIPASNSMG
jgi:hypothetical protein